MQKKKGISLIVLVITIIVMIILAAAIILSLNNAGIIGNGNKAVADSDLANLKNMASLAWAEGYTNKLRDREDLEDYVFDYFKTNNVNIEGYGIEVTEKGVDVVKGWANSGNKIISGTKTIDIGTIINYDPTKGVTDTTKLSHTALQTVTGASANQVYNASDYEGTWKVIGAKDGNILLVSTDNIGIYEVLYCKTYMTCKTELNYISEIYGHGYGAQSARSIDENDVNRLTGYDTKKIESKQVTVVVKNGTVEYTVGNEKLIGEKFVYPEDNEWIRLLDGETRTFNTYKYTYTGFDETGEYPDIDLNMSKDSNEFKLLFRNSNGEIVKYFLATSGINMKETEKGYETFFGSFVVANSAMGLGPSASGVTTGSILDAGVRPIVELQRNIILEKQADGSYNIQ